MTSAARNSMVLLVAILLNAGCGRAVDHPVTTFYIQVIQGVDSNAPPKVAATPVGKKLRQRLQCAFKWETYWEIQRVTLQATPAHPVRGELEDGQAVEIELGKSNQVALRFYSAGKLVRSREQPIDHAFCVSGGCARLDPSRFIIVRRDQPDSMPSP